MWITTEIQSKPQLLLSRHFPAEAHDLREQTNWFCSLGFALSECRHSGRRRSRSRGSRCEGISRRTVVLSRLRSPSRLASGFEPDPGVNRNPLNKSRDRKSTRLNSSHDQISYAVFCLKKKKM